MFILLKAMFILLAAISLSPVQPELRSADVPQIVQTVLEAVIPKERQSGGIPLDALGDKMLILDTAKTTQAFRRVSPSVSPDYREVRRAFVSRTREEATGCGPARSARCNVVDDGVYAAITTIEAEAGTGGYKVRLIILRNSRAPGLLQGYEQELFMTKRNNEWRVDRFGTVRVIH